jgi:hypothetical protein
MHYEESRDQKAIVFWLRNQYPHVIFTCAPVGQRHGTRWQMIKTGADNKKMGYRKGWPDLFIAEPRGGFHGLMIELKKKGEKLNPDQRIILEELNNRGYHAIVSYGVDEAISSVDFYMKLPGYNPIGKC